MYKGSAKPKSNLGYIHETLVATIVVQEYFIWLLLLLLLSLLLFVYHYILFNYYYLVVLILLFLLLVLLSLITIYILQLKCFTGPGESAWLSQQRGFKSYLKGKTISKCLGSS